MLTRLSNKCRADKIDPIRNQALALEGWVKKAEDTKDKFSLRTFFLFQKIT